MAIIQRPQPAVQPGEWGPYLWPTVGLWHHLCPISHTIVHEATYFLNILQTRRLSLQWGPHISASHKLWCHLRQPEWHYAIHLQLPSLAPPRSVRYFSLWPNDGLVGHLNNVPELACGINVWKNKNKKKYVQQEQMWNNNIKIGISISTSTVTKIYHYTFQRLPKRLKPVYPQYLMILCSQRFSTNVLNWSIIGIVDIIWKCLVSEYIWSCHWHCIYKMKVSSLWIFMIWSLHRLQDCFAFHHSAGQYSWLIIYTVYYCCSHNDFTNDWQWQWGIKLTAASGLYRKGLRARPYRDVITKILIIYIGEDRFHR